MDAHELDAARALLSAHERARCEQLARPADRRDYAVAHAMLRVAIADRMGIEPGRVDFGADRYGRPFAVPLAGVPLPPQFSLSRGRGVVAVALLDEGMIGTDVEPVEAAIDAARIARDMFSPDEVSSLDACAAHARASRFCELWTLREALFKAVGFGLGAPPVSASFCVEGGTIALRTAPPLPKQSWTCAVIDAGATHKLAVVASERSGRRGVSLIGAGPESPGTAARPCGPAMILGGTR
jgi:4'-phosphopantetheinyl transferase